MNESFKSKILSGDKKTLSKLNESVMELSIGLFFFASDETIKEYGDWKTKTAKEGAKPFDVLSYLGNLMVSLRRDIGYKETSLNSHDYLKLFITDWEESVSKIPQ